MGCGNHIRLHHVQEDNNSIVVCGTNAIQPKCAIVMVSSVDYGYCSVSFYCVSPGPSWVKICTEMDYCYRYSSLVSILYSKKPIIVCVPRMHLLQSSIDYMVYCNFSYLNHLEQGRSISLKIPKSAYIFMHGI